ncbi:MAG: HNH endonuclease, partial [Tepidisphaeraceae bacterium]
MESALEVEVRQRAGNRCEYCRIPQSAEIVPYQIDHIVAQKHDGPTTSDNLALACLQCNSHKGPNIAGIDPQSRALTRLYHPRLDRWEDHFAMESTGRLSPLTPIGRVTIAVLDMNDSDAISLRASL